MYLCVLIDHRKGGRHGVAALWATGRQSFVVKTIKILSVLLGIVNIRYSTKNQAIRQRRMVFSKYFNIFSLPVSLSLIVCLPYQAGLPIVPTSYLLLPISLPFRRHFCLPNCMLACQWAPPSLSFRPMNVVLDSMKVNKYLKNLAK